MYKMIISAIFFSMTMVACSPNNVVEDNNLKKYFTENNVDGTFAVFDNGKGDFTIYNLNRYKDSAYLPASTFKIVNSLIGIQTGIITNEKMIIKWDGVKRWNEDWNKDLTMEEAFKVSSLPYYQEVARRIGKDTMQTWLDSLSYGTKKITTHIDSFWLDNSLKITPDEQLGLMKKLYFDQLPFNKTTQEIVKRVMIQEKNANYTLAYKTGLGVKEDGRRLGWIIGWVEENRHPYIFVLNIEGDSNTDIVSVRKKMLMDILKHLGFLEGKR
ncbi:MAG: class D beta-lactamase [Chitinophagaceae bacterium]|nr:class D beta-lactamase [Chitinophagaceae bacterium]MCW5905721.1 class D beta-lactamase [Chitinophagaceae bacterium]